MIKLAVCKISMIGSPALILGVSRQYAEGDTTWTIYQLFTLEEYADKKDYLANEWFAAGFEKKKKFHGAESVFFSNINKTVSILQCGHDFNLEEAPQVEISLEEFALLKKDLVEDQWEAFDWETWGK
jgi:hypothetical protein